MAEQYEAGWQCPVCGERRRATGWVDPCLGHLPGIQFACCGHGDEGDTSAYLCFTNGVTLRIKVLAVEYDDGRERLDVDSYRRDRNARIREERKRLLKAHKTPVQRRGKPTGDLA